MAEGQKYSRTFHFPWSPGCTSDDKMAKSTGSLENKRIIASEKLDGSNSGMNRGGVFARSHGAYTHNPWDNILWDIHSRISQDIDEDMFIFGENMYGIHSIEYRALDSYFYVFGIRVGMIWLSWDDVCEMCYLLDLKTVPILADGSYPNIKPLITELVSQPSRLDGFDIFTGVAQMEGCVIRNADSFNELVPGDHDRFNGNLMKWVRANHVTTGEHWTKNWRKATLITY